MFTSAGPQALCASAGLLHVLLAALGAAGPGARGAPPLLIKWLCLCLGRLCQDMPQARPCCCHGIFARRGGAGRKWTPEVHVSHGQSMHNGSINVSGILQEMKHRGCCLRR